MTLPILFLPGMMCDARVWMPQIIALSKDRSVQVASLTQDDTVEAMAETVLADAPGRFALAGFSLGGMVAMEILRRAPDRVDRLALFDTNCQQELPNVAGQREAQIVKARAGRFEEVLAELLPADAIAPGPQRNSVAGMVLDMGDFLGPEVFVRQSRAMQKRPDQQATLRKSKVRALIACGEHDPLTPPRRHEFMAHVMVKARLDVIAGAGHYPMLEAPERVLRSLEVLLAERSPVHE